MPAKSSNKGFSLIELVSALIVLSLVAGAFVNAFFTQAQRNTEPLLEMRAVKYAEALMEEMLSKRFSENTPVGGVPACANATECGDIGPEAGETRIAYDDVDDYHAYCEGENSGVPYTPVNSQGATAALGNSLEALVDYRFSVCVGFDDNYDGTLSGNGARAKLISLKVYPPGVNGPGTGRVIEFRAYRSNF